MWRHDSTVLECGGNDAAFLFTERPGLRVTTNPPAKAVSPLRSATALHTGQVRPVTVHPYAHPEDLTGV